MQARIHILNTPRTSEFVGHIAQVLSERSRSQEESIQASELMEVLQQSYKMMSDLRRTLRKRHTRSHAHQISADTSVAVEFTSTMDLATALEKICLSIQRHVHATLSSHAALKLEL